ncbi:GDSL-type esterase/lipase family protein [Alphaproteobacteria bacterium]|jgi:lysophospholipase L1-like esterase|nr:GDSL-type esterase/lipase family protein [Alphaproteobacteria bacterium]
MRVLVYGDSNSWGYLDDGYGFRCNRRWPVEMKAALAAKNHKIDLIEECLPGRTTNIDDPEMGANLMMESNFSEEGDPSQRPDLTPGYEFNGERSLTTLLMSHQPLDLVMIMLGTNDLKTRFGRNADDITSALMGLAQIVASRPAGAGGWNNAPPPRVILICPLKLGPRADDAAWERAGDWLGGRGTSIQLPAKLQDACASRGIGFIDGNLFAAASDIDPIHWTADAHIAFGNGIADHIVAES